MPARQDCPSCGGRHLTPVYRADGIPTHSTIVLRDAEEARTFPRRDLELAVCHGCGLIFNRLFDPSVVAYSPQFEESQHFSGTFNAFARELAADIAVRCGLSAESHVVEIGCGKGEFLAELCRIAGCEGTGIDPAFRNDRFGENPPPGLTFIADWFGPQYYDLPCDVILSRHTLEHIGPMGEFLGAIRTMVGARPIQLVFETPDVERILAEGAFWDVYYEHVSYFTPATHAGAFRRQGFAVTESKVDFGGQYIVQFAVADSDDSEASDEPGRTETIAAALGFAARSATVRRHWQSVLADARAAGRRVALWGGGSKAVAFIAALAINADAVTVVDKNPFKQGGFLPGSGHQVLAPEALHAVKPDIVIAMNPIYREEIRADLEALGLAPELMAVGA